MFERNSFPIETELSLISICETHSLRCDAKQTEQRFLKLEEDLPPNNRFLLGAFLPSNFVKGSQHNYLDAQEGIPVINTLSIQGMRINEHDCRHISEEDFLNLPEKKKLKKGDVLLTVDGGTSIGKPALFDLEGEWTTDSHVAIIRPKGISPKALIYLLASPMGQVQFQKAESGASGQTAVTEEDIRRFIFPRSALKMLEKNTEKLDLARKALQQQIDMLRDKEIEEWESFTNAMLKPI